MRLVGDFTVDQLKAPIQVGGKINRQIHDAAQSMLPIP